MRVLSCFVGLFGVACGGAVTGGGSGPDVATEETGDEDDGDADGGDAADDATGTAEGSTSGADSGAETDPTGLETGSGETGAMEPGEVGVELCEMPADLVDPDASYGVSARAVTVDGSAMLLAYRLEEEGNTYIARLARSAGMTCAFDYDPSFGDGGRFELVLYNTVTAVAEDDSGRIYVGTRDGPIRVWPPEATVVCPDPAPSSTASVRQLAIEDDGSTGYTLLGDVVLRWNFEAHDCTWEPWAERDGMNGVELVLDPEGGIHVLTDAEPSPRIERFVDGLHAGTYGSELDDALLGWASGLASSSIGVAVQDYSDLYRYDADGTFVDLTDLDDHIDTALARNGGSVVHLISNRRGDAYLFEDPPTHVGEPPKGGWPEEPLFRVWQLGGL